MKLTYKDAAGREHVHPGITFQDKKYVIMLTKPMPRGTLFKGATRVTSTPKFLNFNGGFSKFDKGTWLFNKKSKAIDYSEDLYDWGEVSEFVEIVEVIVENTLSISDLKRFCK